ncbi:MAG: hypothetical protein ACC707_19485 [Thiohalomonadales bacterium]
MAMVKGIFFWMLALSINTESISADLLTGGKVASIMPEQQEILDLSYNKMISAFAQLDEKIERCRGLASSNVLSPALLNSIDLGLEKWKTVLLYFGVNAIRACESERLWGNAIIAMNRYKLVEKYYTGKNVIKIQYQQGDFCCSVWKQEFTLEIEYMDIEVDIRKKLDRNALLKQPYNTVKTINAVEIWLQ